MKPEDIIVGAKYKHKSHPDAVYLGVGMRFKQVDRGFESKHLLIPGKSVLVRYDDINDEFWAGFYLVSETINKQYRLLDSNEIIREGDFSSSIYSTNLSPILYWGWIGKRPIEISHTQRIWREVV